MAITVLISIEEVGICNYSTRATATHQAKILLAMAIKPILVYNTMRERGLHLNLAENRGGVTMFV